MIIKIIKKQINGQINLLEATTLMQNRSKNCATNPRTTLKSHTKNIYYQKPAKTSSMSCIFTVTVTEALVVCPLLEDRGRIT